MIFQVIVWEPPRRYAIRVLRSQDKVIFEHAWRVDPRGDGGSVVHFAVRAEILVPADPQRFAALQARIEEDVARVGARVPHSFD